MLFCFVEKLTMVVTTDIFLKEDLLKLLKNRFIVVIGDSSEYNFRLVSRDFQNFFFSKFDISFIEIDCLFINKKILFSPSLYTAIMFEKSFPYYRYSWLLVYIFLIFRPESYIQRFGSSVAKKWLHLRPATENQGRYLHILRSNRYLRYILPLVREITHIWIYDLF